MLLWCLLVTILLVILISSRNYSLYEFYPGNPVPIRDSVPTLYPTTGPVDMLLMKKFLIFDGYRFQNSLSPPNAINLNVDLKGHPGVSYAYPDNFRLRTGVFKERAFVEKFTGSDKNIVSSSLLETFIGGGGGHGGGASGGTGGSTVQGTISQLNAKSKQDEYLLGNKGDPIEDSGIRMNPFGKWVSMANPGRVSQVGYPNKPFSWGDIINRFYTGPFAAPDIVI